MTVNVENINALADFIESEGYAFYMDDGRPNLSRRFAGCIGGHAAVLWPHLHRPGRPVLAWCFEGLADQLGVSAQAHNELVYGNDEEANVHLNTRHVSRAQAVKVLRHLAETGEVKWSIILDGDK